MRFYAHAYLFISTLVLGVSLAQAQASYLFGVSPVEGFGPLSSGQSLRYVNTIRNVTSVGFRPLLESYGSQAPSDLRIVIKDDEIFSKLAQQFVGTLSFQKANLMKIYRLSNQDYNRLAAIAFGILGKETKFGTSFKYRWKEDHQGPVSVDLDVPIPGFPAGPFKVHVGSIPSPIYLSKIARMKQRDLDAAITSGDIQKLLNPEKTTVRGNSRGLTQIKNVPDPIEQYYCVNEDQLTDARVAAVATLGFLADSLKITRSFARVRHLDYINSENIYDYVLYVYFGSSRQLANPKFGYKTVLSRPDQTNFGFYAGRMYERARSYLSGKDAKSPDRTIWTQVNETATPDKNVYVQSVKQYIRALAMFENSRQPFPMASDNACRAQINDSN